MDDRPSEDPEAFNSAVRRQRPGDLQHEVRLFQLQVERSFEVPAGPAMRDYSEHLGYVILRAAEADVRTAGVASILHSSADGYRGDILGLSGEQLVACLRTVAHLVPAEFTSFVDRYRRAFRRRNQIVHAIRPDGDWDGDAEHFERTVRVIRGGTKWILSLSSVPTSIETITVENLVEFEFELQDLNFAAGSWFNALKEAGFGP